MLGEYTFEEMKKEKTTGSILSDRYLQTRRVRRIANEITQALMRGISREDKEKGRRWWRGSRVATSHLDGLKWEIYVVDQPIINACCLPGGKIVVFTGLLRHFKSDEEIATILGHEFGHAVARHTAETITNYMWLVILQLIFFQFFSGAVAAHSFDKLSNLLFSLPFSRRMQRFAFLMILGQMDLRSKKEIWWHTNLMPWNFWGDDAEEFRPERWLDHKGLFQQESPFKFTAFPAFHAGPRICLGKEFAYRQMKIFSAVLLGNYIFKMSDEVKVVNYKTMITLHIEGGLYVHASPRSGHGRA